MMMYGFVCIQSDRVLIDNTPQLPSFVSTQRGQQQETVILCTLVNIGRPSVVSRQIKISFPPPSSSLLPLLFCILMTSSGTKKFGSNVTGVDETKPEGKKQ